MKKWFLMTGLILYILVLAACGGSGQAAQQAEETPPSPPDLTGEWTQTNSNSEDAWQMAVITNTDITVYWVMDNGDTKSLYLGFPERHRANRNGDTCQWGRYKGVYL